MYASGFRSFSLPIWGAFHLSFTVLCTIGRSGVFSLGGWSPHIQTGFHVSRPTQELFCFLPIPGYHRLWREFPITVSSYKTTTGLFPVRSPLLRESRLMSFPLGTEMFHFPRFASPCLCIQQEIPHTWWVSPFGNPRIKVWSQLPGAYRSVPRPSSPLIAKASTRCTLTLKFKSRAGINPLPREIERFFNYSQFFDLDTMLSHTRLAHTTTFKTYSRCKKNRRPTVFI